MSMVDITVPGLPVAKGRPRFSRKSGRTFTPARTQQAEDTLAGRALVELAPVRASLPLAGPLRLTAIFVMPIAASWSKAKRADALAGRIHPTGRPDVDNLVKLATDALNGVVWVDDAQLVQVSMEKRFGEVPSTRLVVDEVRGAA